MSVLVAQVEGTNLIQSSLFFFYIFLCFNFSRWQLHKHVLSPTHFYSRFFVYDFKNMCFYFLEQENAAWLHDEGTGRQSLGFKAFHELPASLFKLWTSSPPSNREHQAHTRGASLDASRDASRGASRLAHAQRRRAQAAANGDAVALRRVGDATFFATGLFKTCLFSFFKFPGKLIRQRQWSDPILGWLSNGDIKRSKEKAKKMKTCWFVPNEANLFDPWGDHALLGRGQSIDTAAATVCYEKVFSARYKWLPFSTWFLFCPV